MKRKLLLIDTFNFLHRAYHALPKTLTDKEGNPTNAVYGVTSMLISVFDALEPDYVIAAMDSKEPTFRVEEFTGYKAHRKPMEDDLSRQIPMVLEVLEAFGIERITANGYEADDIIGTVSKSFGSDELDIIIVSNDRDLWQLVDDNIRVMSPSKGNKVDWIGESEVLKRMGFTPDLLIDYKALRGDPSDNIPGVHGVGEKSALKLITRFGNLEEIYKHIDEVEPNSLKEKLANNAEEAAMSKKLATIITDAPIDVDIEKCRYRHFNKANVVDVLRKYNFRSLIRRLGFDDTPKPKQPKKNEDQLSLL